MKHKHAELMMDYAKDAMETNTPWKRWEFSDAGIWRQLLCHPFWDSDTEYRRKPMTININGHEVPKAYRGVMRRSQFYPIPNLENSDHYTELNWLEDSRDQTAMERGLVHLTKEAARKHAEALLSFTKLS